jgi:hypothetical protein
MPADQDGEGVLVAFDRVALQELVVGQGRREVDGSQPPDEADNWAD